MLFVAALAAAGCGGGADRAPAPRATASATQPARAPAPQAPVLCGRLRSRLAGRVDAPVATELSGLARSRSGRFWAHNDSGDVPRVFALGRDGRLLREVALSGAESIDWEDIAIRGRTVYVGDIGDNTAQRPEVVVYRFREPPAGVASVAAERIALRYPDRAHDAEALLVDPRGGSLAIVTKNLGGTAGVYIGRSGTLRRAGTLRLGIGQPITAGDVSADGRVIALRSYDRAFVWTRRGGESRARALQRKPGLAAVDLLAEGQGESLARTRDGRAFYTVPEGPQPALRRYGA